VEYDGDLFAAYERAVKQEIDLYAPFLKGLPFTSLYIGGGTPTVDWRGLIAVLDHFRRRLDLNCKISIELHPASMDEDCLRELKSAGVTCLSVGVESTSDRILRRIGRNHDGTTAIRAVDRALRLDFNSVNVDLMFALPGQTPGAWRTDVKTLVDLGVDQLSTYPMFSFPYSDLGRSRGIGRVERPPHSTVKSMLEYTDDYCEEAGLARCAVWSWLKPGRYKFSSITRHHYIGFGPSAASMTGTSFYVNTFDVSAYAARLPAQRPVAVAMPIDDRIEKAYWLYWRIYELLVGRGEFQTLFGPESSLDREFGHLLRPLVALGLLGASSSGYRVTRSGAYWIHRLQNEYSLSYINHLWGTCRSDPWPSEVLL